MTGTEAFAAVIFGLLIIGFLWLMVVTYWYTRHVTLTLGGLTLIVWFVTSKPQLGLIEIETDMDPGLVGLLITFGVSAVICVPLAIWIYRSEVPK